MNTMTKPTYFFIGAALLLSACAQDDDIPGRVEGESNRIAFRTSLPGLTSRQIVTDKNMDYFHVTAFDAANPDLIAPNGGSLAAHFNNERIEIVEGQDSYSSEDCIWPKPGYESHNLIFLAYYPASGDNEPVNGTTVTDGTMNLDYKLTDFCVEPEIADQVDFVTAHTAGTMEENLFTGITLPFVHQLCRIEVKAWSKHKSCDIEIAGVRIGGINMKGTFNFRTDNSGGFWSDFSDKGIAEYVFCKDDEIVSLVKGAAATSTDKGAVSIMGNTQPDGNNAMLIPTAYAVGWDAADDRNNADKNMYISVLLRVIDATTPTAGEHPAEKQRYPYKDLSQGADALQIPVVYFAVDKEKKTICARLYKNKENAYFTDEDCTADAAYELPANEEVKEFGWAAFPATGNWAPGYVYTYTLDYSSGVGLHDPEVATGSPKAGDPIISDKVGVTYSVKDWQPGGGNECIVPGS